MASLLAGIVMVGLAAVPVTETGEMRTLEGEVPPLSEGEDALEVPEAPFEGAGFAEAQAPNLTCGVSVVFLEENELRAFQETGELPTPQLHCDQAATRLPGSIAAAYVQNQRLTAANWSFSLQLFAVSHPYALLGLPAIGFLLAGGIGLAAISLQRQLLRWLEEKE